MMAQFADAQPDRDGKTRTDNRDSDDPASDRRDIGTGLAAATTPPADNCRRGDRHGDGEHRTAHRPDDSGRRHRPTGERRRDQPQIQPGGAGIHRLHTRTRSRSFSSRAGPMPSTSPSWSTLVNRPLASRQAMMAAAVTGPTPGRASNSCTDAMFRSTKPSGVGAFPAVDGASVAAALAVPELIELPMAA